MQSRWRVGLVLSLVITCTARAEFGFMGYINNDGERLTYNPTLLPKPMLDGEPEVVGFANPRAMGSIYYGAGLTHEQLPSIVWSGDVLADVAIVIDGLMHDGQAVTSGLRFASGELGGFDDIGAGNPPQNQVGLGEPLTILTQELLESRNEQEEGAAHLHLYVEADAAGEWTVTAHLTDVSETPAFENSASFSIIFTAVDLGTGQGNDNSPAQNDNMTIDNDNQGDGDGPTQAPVTCGMLGILSLALSFGSLLALRFAHRSTKQ